MGEYIREFETVSEYTASRENNYIEPWVSLTDSTGDLNYNKSEYEKLLSMPLTTIAEEDGTISFNIWKSMGTNMITSVSYSTDNGETWTTTNNTNNKSENLVITVNVNEGDRVMWKANAQQTGYYEEDAESGDVVYVGSFFSSTCEFDVEGNVMSMINDATGLTYDAQLCCLFYDYYGETECLVVDASKLLLPATTLTDSCYFNMFLNCSSLTQAPELPATTLATACYSSMFWGCTNLTTAPELPATTLATACYESMFQGCTSLATAPELPATTLASYCYWYMFNNCTSLNYIKCLATTNINATNCNNWVNGVAASGTFVGDPNSTWTIGKNGIPSGWNYNNVNIMLT